MASDLQMNDVSIIAYADSIEKMLIQQDELLEAYIDILTNIKNNAIKSGEIHDVIVKIEDIANKIYIDSKGKGTAIKNELISFVNRIDEIDLGLYGD